jgi:hypothetical protein
MKKSQKRLLLPGETPIERLAKPFEEFAKLEASGGILLIGCTVAALLWANSPWAATYFSLWHNEADSRLRRPSTLQRTALLDQRRVDGDLLSPRRSRDQTGGADWRTSFLAQSRAPAGRRPRWDACSSRFLFSF